MSDPQLRQLQTVLRGCIRGGDHARALRLIITNHERVTDPVALRLMTSRVLQSLGHTQEAIEINELCSKHLAHSGQILGAMVVAAETAQLSSNAEVLWGYLASLCCKGSPFIEGPDKGSSLDTMTSTKELDLSGVTPFDPLDVLVQQAIHIALVPEGLSQAPDSIKALPALSHLKREELAALMRVLKVRSFGRGELVLSQGQESTGAMWLARGRLEATDKEGRKRDLSPGTLLQHRALWDDSSVNTPHNLELVAQSEGELLVLERESLEILTQAPMILSKFQRFDAACQLERALMTSQMFSLLPTQGKRDLWKQMEPCALEPNTTLIVEGQESDGVYIIIEGKFLVCKGHGEQRTQINTADAGAVLGEISLLTSGPAIASVISQTPARVLYLERIQALALCESYPEIMENLRTTAAQRLLDPAE